MYKNQEVISNIASLKITGYYNYYECSKNWNYFSAYNWTDELGQAQSTHTLLNKKWTLENTVCSTYGRHFMICVANEHYRQ